MVYYNENDRRAAAWLRELIKAGHIADGHVDERSITEIPPHELTGYVQQHFFAGIGGWSLALRLAGWPDSRPVRTGSCPCQPFSQAGKGLGEKDARHLWPTFRDLLAFGNPTVTFGEQVASKDGRAWLARVRADLEGLGYGVGCADLCAAGVGAPHIRQRLFWVADSTSTRRNGTIKGAKGNPRKEAWMLLPSASSGAGRMVDADGAGCREQSGALPVSPEQSSSKLPSNAWNRFDLLPCTDGKTRRIESGSFPLAHGIPGRVGLLRGYGNAIVPQVAAEFIKAFLDLENA